MIHKHMSADISWSKWRNNVSVSLDSLEAPSTTPLYPGPIRHTWKSSPWLGTRTSISALICHSRTSNLPYTSVNFYHIWFCQLICVLFTTSAHNACLFVMAFGWKFSMLEALFLSVYRCVCLSTRLLKMLCADCDKFFAHLGKVIDFAGDQNVMTPLVCVSNEQMLISYNRQFLQF